jgi:hypothetical protein
MAAATTTTVTTAADAPRLSARAPADERPIKPAAVAAGAPTLVGASDAVMTASSLVPSDAVTTAPPHVSEGGSARLAGGASAAPPAFAASVGDVKVSQMANASPPAYSDRFTTPTANSLWGFDSSGHPVDVIVPIRLISTEKEIEIP